MIHKDLKPENIFFRERNKVKTFCLGDFGCASPSGSSDPCGTAQYQFKRFHMPLDGNGTYACHEPSILEKFQVPFADIWVMGVILFEAMVGYFPPAISFMAHEKRQARALERGIIQTQEDRIKSNIEFAQRHTIGDMKGELAKGYTQGKLSYEAYAFFDAIFCCSIKEEPTAEQLLKHEWLSAHVPARGALWRSLVPEWRAERDLAKQVGTIIIDAIVNPAPEPTTSPLVLWAPVTAPIVVPVATPRGERAASQHDGPNAASMEDAAADAADPPSVSPSAEQQQVQADQHSSMWIPNLPRIAELPDDASGSGNSSSCSSGGGGGGVPAPAEGCEPQQQQQDSVDPQQLPAFWDPLLGPDSFAAEFAMSPADVQLPLLLPAAEACDSSSSSSSDDSTGSSGGIAPGAAAAAAGNITHPSAAEQHNTHSSSRIAAAGGSGVGTWQAVLGRNFFTAEFAVYGFNPQMPLLQPAMTWEDRTADSNSSNSSSRGSSSDAGSTHPAAPSAVAILRPHRPLGSLSGSLAAAHSSISNGVDYSSSSSSGGNGGGAAASGDWAALRHLFPASLAAGLGSEQAGIRTGDSSGSSNSRSSGAAAAGGGEEDDDWAALCSYFPADFPASSVTYSSSTPGGGSSSSSSSSRLLCGSDEAYWRDIRAFFPTEFGAATWDNMSSSSSSRLLSSNDEEYWKDIRAFFPTDFGAATCDSMTTSSTTTSSSSSAYMPGGSSTASSSSVCSSDLEAADGFITILSTPPAAVDKAMGSVYTDDGVGRGKSSSVSCSSLTGASADSVSSSSSSSVMCDASLAIPAGLPGWLHPAWLTGKFNRRVQHPQVAGLLWL